MTPRFLGRICIILGISACLGACRSDRFSWQEGDILFQDGDCGGFCDAIRKVTTGHQGRDFSHNGLLVKDNGNWMVLEAVSKGVVLTPLETFLNRSLDELGNPKVVVGRLKPEFQELIGPAIAAAATHLGKSYDDAFDLENDKFYCSELIHVAFKAAQKGEDLFEPKPMTFKDSDTGEVFPVSETYFSELGIPVPEGKLGLNPGGMFLAPVLDIMEIN